MAGAVPFPALTPHALDAVPPALRGGIVTIGAFDGIHRGHQALLAVARREADARGVPAVVLTFEPHPRAILRPHDPVFRLTPLPVRARILKALGLDGLVVVPFDSSFASTPAASFIDDVLVGRLALSGVVVGRDFHFGRGREGTVAMLAAGGDRFGFSIAEVDRVENAVGAPYASRTIRTYLAEGEIAAANADLGYRWFVEGEIVAGDRRGRTLGYPTANMHLGGDCQLRHGIYAVRLQRADGTIHSGVASYGRRPTFDNGAPLLETFVFDFSGDLYGETVSVAFVDWIRPELKFASASDLVAAMDRDSAAARAALASAGPGSSLDIALATLG